MSWSPEELVKQLRYPSGYPAEFERQLMRDAADMIDRLRAELAEKNDLLDSVVREGLAAAAAIARVRELCELAIRDPDSGVGIEDIVNAIEGVQP